MEAKPGYLTTELYVTAGVAMASMLNRKLGLGLEQGEILGLVTLAVGYVASRAYLKSKTAPSTKE